MHNKYLPSALALVAGLFCLSAFAGHEHGKIDNKMLNKAVEMRSDDERKRDHYRHPAETISFFQLEPGMKVAEALPGGGWYTKILVNYLGKDSEIYGINYADDMWPRFGFFNEERINDFISRTKAFPGMVAEATDNGIKADGYTFKTIPDELAGTLDRVLYVRALHNLSRFEDEAGTLTQALGATHKMLKPGGMVGVVQHRVDDSASAESAKGQRGYLKQSNVIVAFNKAGFDLIATSEVNANPKDNPSESEVVWRLPPSLNGSKDDPEKRKAMQAIGESDRMTLLFKKR